MSQMNRVLILPASVLLLILMVAAAGADMSGDCITCHGEKSIINQGANLYVDPAKYSLTTHARIGCPVSYTHLTLPTKRIV